MDSRALQYQLRTHMTADQSYSYAGMNLLYIQIISQECFLKCKKIKPQTLRRRLRGWSQTDGSWLKKEGVGMDAKFTKVDYGTPCVFSKLYYRAMEILNRSDRRG